MPGSAEGLTDATPLVRALVDAVVFLSDSPDDVVDPDEAVRCLEGVSQHLLALSESDQLWLRSALRASAEDEKGPRAVIVAGIPDSLGLAG